MDGQLEKRMAENYEITQVVQIGHKEVVMGMDETNAMPYFCASYFENEIGGSYHDCMVSDDYVEIVEIFAERVREQCKQVREEQQKREMCGGIISVEMCQPLTHDTSLTGKIAAVKKEALRPEYQSVSYQLVYVTGGNGARGNARGNACFGTNLYDGERHKWARGAFYGEVKPEFLPDWAKARAEKIQKKEQDREVR